MESAINREDLFNCINEGILEERYLAFKRNLEKNFPLIKKYGGLARIVPELSGRHIVIAGAGPSLDNNLKELKKYQFRREIILISADMALRPLVANGIFPRYVISCESTPSGFFNGLPTEGMHLLAFSCISASNLRKWNGDVSFYNWLLHNDMYNELWSMAGEDLGYAATGSIVTTQAVSIALGCGIKSLMLTGNDMGFYRSYYAGNTITHVKWLMRATRFNTPETMEGNAIRRARHYEINRENRKFYTNSQFLSARIWLDELFKKQKLPIYDSSVPGCSAQAVLKSDLKRYFYLLETRS